MTTPTATATPNDPTSASGIGLAAGVGGSVGVILVAIFIVVFIIVFCCCIQRKSSDDPEGKGTRCFSWKPKEDVETGRYIRQPRESYAMTTPKIHVSQNEQFHAGDTPELRRQIAVPNGSRNHSLDPLEPIYNVSLNSGRSGESALSDSDSLSCPPSPAVSSIHEEDVSTSDSPYQPRPIISIGDERLGQYPDHHYFQQQVNQDQFLEQSRKYAPSQTSSLGIQNIFEGYPETGYGSQYDTHPAYHHSSCDPLSSLGVPLKEPRLGSTSSVHSDKTHSTRHSKGSSKSGKSSHSGRLDVEHEHLSQRMSPHHYDEHNRRHSPSSHHSDRYSDRYSDRHSDHHGDHHSDRHSDHHSDRNSDHLRSHSRSPRSHSPRAAMECAPHEAPQLSGYGQPNQYRSHHVLPIGHDYQAKGAPMRTTRSAEWARSSLFPPHPHEPENRQEQEPPPTETQHSDEPDAAPGEIIDEVLLMAVGCLMHQENCQIHKCPCKQVKKRFHNILPQTRLHMQKEADKVVEDAQSGNFDPSDRRQQMRISLSSQNFSKDIHAHYHMTSRSHIRPSDGRQRILQRRRSRSVDLTPVVEQPESCATTPGVVIPDGARGLLCGPMFSPAVTPAGEKFKVLSPTVPATNTVVPTVLLREISMSADNLPSLCLNDCPMAVTPMTQLGNRPLGYAMKSLSTTQCQWSADSADKPMPSAQEKESPSSDEGKVSDRYTSQDSSSSLQTTFTQSSGQSGKSEEISVFEDSGLQNRLYDAQTSTSTTSTEPEHSVRRKQYMVRGKQNEMTHEPDGILHLDSGYGTSGDATDGELSLQRSRLPPGDLPLSPPKIPAKQKNFALEQPKHLVPVANSNKRAQRSGSTSSHSSHASHLSTASVGSHVSQASDGSITTQTLC